MKDYLRGCRGMTAATILFLLIETALQTLSATILARLLDTAAARDAAGALRLFALNAVVFGAGSSSGCCWRAFWPRDAGSSSWMKPPAPRTPPTPMPSRAACCATRP